MHGEQKLSPKYYVAHDPSTDDVLMSTACKSLKGCRELALDKCSNDAKKLEIILIEILRVEEVDEFPVQ